MEKECHITYRLAQMSFNEGEYAPNDYRTNLLECCSLVGVKTLARSSCSWKSGLFNTITMSFGNYLSGCL